MIHLYRAHGVDSASCWIVIHNLIYSSHIFQIITNVPCVHMYTYFNSTHQQLTETSEIDTFVGCGPCRPKCRNVWATFCGGARHHPSSHYERCLHQQQMSSKISCSLFPSILNYNWWSHPSFIYFQYLIEHCEVADKLKIWRKCIIKTIILTRWGQSTPWTDVVIVLLRIAFKSRVKQMFCRWREIIKRLRQNCITIKLKHFPIPLIC